jgi:hypothetical protein
MLVDTGAVQTASIKPGRGKTVLVGISTITGQVAAPIPELSGGGVRWTRLDSFAETRGGVRGPRRLSLFAASGVGPGPLTISVPPQHKQYVSWSVVQASGQVVQIGSTGEPLAGPPAEVSLETPPAATVVAFFLVGTSATIDAVAPAEKLGQGSTRGFFSSTSSYASTQQSVQSTWSPDGPGHYLASIVEMSA